MPETCAKRIKSKAMWKTLLNSKKNKHPGFLPDAPVNRIFLYALITVSRLNFELNREMVIFHNNPLEKPGDILTVFYGSSSYRRCMFDMVLLLIYSVLYSVFKQVLKTALYAFSASSGSTTRPLHPQELLPRVRVFGQSPLLKSNARYFISLRKKLCRTISTLSP